MPVESILRVSDALGRFADRVGKFGSIFIVPLVFVTMWDVTMRKVGGIQVWLVENVSKYMGSTIVQELEWHFHTAFFTLVLGYGFILNRHVRVDLLRENLSFRTQVWIEFLGCLIFLIPYCMIVGYFAFDYAVQAFLANEISASTVGLTHRWIIKSVLVVGMFVAGFAGIAVWLQSLAVLIAPKDKRFHLWTLDWPEEQERKRKSFADLKAANKAQADAEKAARAEARTKHA